MLKVKFPQLDKDLFSQIEILCEEILLSGVTLCSLDTETSVNFISHQSGARDPRDQLVSIIQICIRKDSNGTPLNLGLEITEKEIYTCFVIPIKMVYLLCGQIPHNLNKLLNHKDIVKVGCDICGDVIKIYQSYGISTMPIIDCQDIAKTLGNFKYSLDDLSFKYLRLNKLESQLGNYDGWLTHKQIEYAAYDAYLSLALYRKMIGIDKLQPLFYTPPDHEFDGTIEDALQVLQYLNDRDFLNGSKGADFETLCNVVSSGFNVWGKQNLRSNLEEAFKILSDDGYLRYNEVTGLWNRSSPNGSDDEKKSGSEFIYDISLVNKILEICQKNITVHGIKKIKLLNTIDNSQVTKAFAEQDKRFELYSQILNDLITQGKLTVSESGKIYKK